MSEKSSSDTVGKANEVASGCFQCGSPEGGAMRLCPSCTAAQAAKREISRKKLKVDTTGDRDTFLFKVVTVSLVTKVGLAVVVILGMLAVIGYAQDRGLSPIPFIILFSVVATGLLTLIALVSILGVIVAGDRDLGMKMVVCFPLMYPLLWRAAREESSLWDAVRHLVIAHGVGVVLLIATLVTASSISINLFSPATYGFAPVASPSVTPPQESWFGKSNTSKPAEPSTGNAASRSEYSGYDY